MDPNATLAAMRAAIKEFDLEADRESAFTYAIEVVSAATALDEWLSRGGFLPTDWQRTTYTG